MRDVKRVHTLTPRELEILKLMATGLTMREIARALNISYKTARVHADNINSKLNTQSRVQAVISGLELGFVQLKNKLSPEAQVILKLLEVYPQVVQELQDAGIVLSR